jgi:hypothetical protein
LFIYRDYRAEFVKVNREYGENTKEIYRPVLPGYERDSLHYIAQNARKPAARSLEIFDLFWP